MSDIRPWFPKDLKHCPFCGGHPVWRSGKNEQLGDYAEVRCMDCGASVRVGQKVKCDHCGNYHQGSDMPEQKTLNHRAGKLWNTRRKTAKRKVKKK